MKTTFRGERFWIWVILSVILFLLWVVVMRGIATNRSDTEEIYLQNELQSLEGEVDSILLTYSKFSDYIFDELDQDQEIKDIMEKANSASISEKEVLRDRLYQKTYNKYLSMKEYEYRQFQFHLANTESFLRLHAPEKYGDLLLGIRESVRLTNENLEKTTCFEEGRIFNGFRYVYPLLNKDKHIGSVEVSVSSRSIIKILSQLYQNEDFYFIIDKAVADQKLFEEELSNYQDLAILEGFYLDKDIMEIAELNRTVVSDLEESFFQKAVDINSDKIKNKESFSTVNNYNGKNYTITFLAIENIEKTPVAYLISIQESQGFERIIKSNNLQVMMVTLLFVLIILFGLLLVFYYKKLRERAERDDLTNLYNRNKFYELAKIEEKSAMQFKYQSAVLLLDIDRFKKINDKYGHKWGDQVLTKLASEITKNLRERDIFARWGGEEFVLLLPDTGKSEAFNLAEKIRKTICQSPDEQLNKITISIGVATIDPDNYNIDRAIMQADQAMYRAKAKGRNQVR